MMSDWSSWSVSFRNGKRVSGLVFQSTTKANKKNKKRKKKKKKKKDSRVNKQQRETLALIGN